MINGTLIKFEEDQFELKFDKSDGKSHGIEPFWPITLFSATATIKLKLNILTPQLEQEYVDEKYNLPRQNLQIQNQKYFPDWK